MPIKPLLAALTAMACFPTSTLVTAKPIEIEFARIEQTPPLLLDLHLPEQQDAPALIVWIHGGAWKGGSRSNLPLKDLLKKGWTIASVDYRLSTQAKFPAQIHDIKAAIRFLRSQQDVYGYDASQIVIAGASAGGHLAALVGVTNHHAELEGSVGEFPNEDSSVQCIVSLYGASNLTTILQQSTPHGLKVRIPALQLFLGAQPEEDITLAQLASPVFHIDPNDPPCLLVHGVQDPQMPVSQSLELHSTYQEMKLQSQLELIASGAHGGELFYDAKRIDIIDTFIRQQLK